jgi:hypothetical protein
MLIPSGGENIWQKSVSEIRRISFEVELAAVNGIIADVSSFHLHSFGAVTNLDPGLGCQMVYLKTKIPNLGIFLRDLEWKMLAYFTTI